MLLPHIARSPDGSTPLFSALDYNIRIGSGLATVQGAKDNVSLNSKQSLFKYFFKTKEQGINIENTNF